MNALILVLLVAFAASPVHAEPRKKESGFQKVLKSMFPSSKPKVVPKRTKKSKPKPTATPTPKSKKHEVDSEWIARYLEQEAAWDYEIPDDDLIEWKDGKYHVPSVVFRHYEDMLNTPRRSPTATPTVSPTLDSP